MPDVASAELAAALVTTALEAHDRRPFANSSTFERVAPAQEYHKLAAAAGLGGVHAKDLAEVSGAGVERLAAAEGVPVPTFVMRKFRW